MVQPETGFWSELESVERASGIWDQEWERSQLSRCLEEARSESEQTTFKAFNAVVRGDRSPGDVARGLGVSVKSVYNAKHRVLNRLRELKAEYDSE
jgi:RNA polymerase sigma-70 factor (ECF subfamily)